MTRSVPKSRVVSLDRIRDVDMTVGANVTEGDVRPWYREQWVWFLLGIPAASVILSSIMVYVAVTTEDSLVSDDYYKEGMAFNQRLDKDKLAGALGVEAMVSQDIQSQTLRVTLSGSSDASVTESPVLFVELEHPTLKTQDLFLRLIPNGDHYLGSLDTMPEGKYYLTLTDSMESWRLQGVAFFPLQQLTLSPKPEFMTEQP